MNTYQSNRSLLQQSRSLRRQKTCHNLKYNSVSTQLKESSKTQSSFGISSVAQEICNEAKAQLQKMKKENQALRLEYESIKNELKWYKIFVKQYQDLINLNINVAPILAQMQNQRNKLKKIIQKSYNSLRKAQKESINQSNQISFLTLENNQKLRKLQILELQNQNLRKKLYQSNSFSHQKQIQQLNLKVRNIQKIIEHLLCQFQQAKQIEEKQRNELLELKRFYNMNLIEQ